LSATGIVMWLGRRRFRKFSTKDRALGKRA
jgi:hypothetical protein